MLSLVGGERIGGKEALGHLIHASGNTAKLNIPYYISSARKNPYVCTEFTFTAAQTGFQC